MMENNCEMGDWLHIRKLDFKKSRQNVHFSLLLIKNEMIERHARKMSDLKAFYNCISLFF